MVVNNSKETSYYDKTRDVQSNKASGLREFQMAKTQGTPKGEGLSVPNNISENYSIFLVVLVSNAQAARADPS